MTTSMFTDRYDHFRQMLVKRRKAIKLSQENLGKKVDTDQSTVSKMERGVRRIDVVEMIDMAEALGLDPHDIITELQKIKS